VSDHDEKYAAACLLLSEKCPKHGTLWRHVKTGHLYHVVQGCVIEATLTPAVLYTAATTFGAVTEYAHACVSWVRPLSEFLDGRFEALPRENP
jgi:hypothetical protein